MQSTQQNIPNLAAGFKNHINGINLAQNTPNPMAQMTQGLVPGNFQFPQSIGQNMMQTGGDVVDTISFFGQTIQKKYFYLLVALLAIAVGYCFWKWYSGKKKPEEENDDDDDSEEDEINYEQQQMLHGFPQQMGMLPMMSPQMMKRFNQQNMNKHADKINQKMDQDEEVES
jgi:hypothetical protein